MIARILEILLVLGIVTQIGLPFIFGRPLFPLFRARKQSTLLSAIEQAREGLSEDEMEEYLAKLNALRKHPIKEEETKTNVQ